MLADIRACSNECLTSFHTWCALDCEYCILINGSIVPQSKGHAAESVAAGPVVSNGVQHNAAAMPLKVSFTSLTISNPYFCIFYS